LGECSPNRRGEDWEQEHHQAERTEGSISFHIARFNWISATASSPAL
jgi:hypothetical protein